MVSVDLQCCLGVLYSGTRCVVEDIDLVTSTLRRSLRVSISRVELGLCEHGLGVVGVSDQMVDLLSHQGDFGGVLQQRFPHWRYFNKVTLAGSRAVLDADHQMTSPISMVVFYPHVVQKVDGIVHAIDVLLEVTEPVGLGQCAHNKTSDKEQIAHGEV